MNLTVAISIPAILWKTPENIDYFINKLKDYQSLVYEYNEKARQYKSKNERYNEIIDNLKELQDMIFDSKIINKGRWVELNDIKFELIAQEKTN